MIQWMSGKASNDIWLATFCWVYLDCLRDSLGMINPAVFIEQLSQWRFPGILESALWEMGPKVSSPGDLRVPLNCSCKLKDGWQLIPESEMAK